MLSCSPTEDEDPSSTPLDHPKCLPQVIYYILLDDGLFLFAVDLPLQLAKFTLAILSFPTPFGLTSAHLSVLGSPLECKVLLKYLA